MSRPWKHPKTGVYWLRKRVPDDLRTAVGKSEEKRSLGDAGMISLGFFRILELEFNERLILPMMQAFDMDAFEQELDALKGGERHGATKKAIEFWEKMIGQLRQAKRGRKGLELGALELLLQKVSAATGVDSSLKASLHSRLCQYLSPAGIDAFKSGELAKLLSRSVRDKFRNPPAHSRYVGIATARECKSLIDSALGDLIAYTLDEASRAPTMH
jgi:hypothetical protein